MDTTTRVQRWRQRRRDEGKEAMTIWLSHDTKLRLEALATVWRVTPSELIEQALAQFQPGSPPRFGNDTETTQLRGRRGRAGTGTAGADTGSAPASATCYSYER